MSTQPTTPDLGTPVVGSPIAVAFFDGDHVVHFSVAHVLSLGPIEAATGKPTISVAYPDPDAEPTVLSSASWFKGYVRRTGVQHVSSPDVQESRVSIGYGDPVDLAKGAQPSIPAPAGDADNPIFDRADDVVPTHVSLGQASIVQSAKTPRETVVSPLTSDLTTGEVLPEQGEAVQVASAEGAVFMPKDPTSMADVQAAQASAKDDHTPNDAGVTAEQANPSEPASETEPLPPAA
jgi:hypothetical protein